MGTYDAQLKNYYAKASSGNADLGLYQKQNKDGSVSASKEVQDRAAANRHIYAEIAPTLANSTNKAGYASWMKPNNDVYFGSQTFDGDAFNAARSDFMDNFMLNTKTANKNANHPKYGYDWNDPEDVQRYEQGKISKKYEGTYTDDPFDQWLKAHGQASASYFNDTYYPKAYSKVTAERAEQQKAKNFKNAVVQEVWSTASDCMNITDEEMVAAYQRVKRSNPIYDSIEIYNPKDNDTDFSDYASPLLAEQAAQEESEIKRAGKLDISEIWGDLEALQKQQTYYETRDKALAQKASTQKANQSQSIINDAISNNGFSVEIDKRIGLARDSKLDEYYTNKQRKQAASDAAINAMREAGYSKQDIQKAIRQDGRLSYSESTEGKANEAERIARRDSSDATSAKILNGMDSFTQGAVDKAKKLGNMGTSAQQGFSPISMMEGYGMSAQETQAVNNYVDTTRAILETQGYNGLEIDNALRRADLGEYIPTATARTNYATYTLQECGYSDEQIQQVLATYTEEDWKNTDKDMLASDYVENSMADQLANSIISMPIRAALSIACGAVGLVDMGAAAISGRKELWKFTDDLQELSAWVTQFSHDRNHEIISTAADVGAEIMRMRATALIGSALTPAATTTSGSAAGTNFLFNFMQKNASHLPFISGAIGNYYLEAVNGGATPRMAALYAIPAGALEGYLESLEMGEVLQHTFGMNIVGKKIAASGLSANFKQFAITKGMPFINFALGTIGEGLEEAASYYGSSIARMATWDKGYEMDFSEMWDNAKGGLLIGGIMNGLSMGAHTQSYKYASEIYKGTGGNYAAYLDSFMSAMHMENMNDVQRQALIDKYNSGEINVSRDAAINAGVEIQTNAEVVAAKKQAVESAENDAAVKVENANNKVTQAEQRLAGIDDPDPVKKGKKLTQAARELTAAKAAASQTASEGQKKVDTATADYKSEAAKAKRKNAANQQLVDEYHASKYCSDIEAETDIAVEAAITAEDVASLESLLQSEKDKLAAMPYQNSKAAIRRKGRIAKLENQIASGKAALNAAVSPAAVEPTENTTAPTNTAENRIDTVKKDVTEKRERIEFLKGEIMRKSLEYEAMPEPAEDSEDTEAVLRYEELGVELDNLEDELEALTAEVEAAETAEAEPTSNTNADANTAQNGIDNIKNGVAQVANEKYNNNRGDINGAAEIEAGGNAGISGQTVTVPYSGMAQGLPGMDRRADYRGIGSPVKDIIRQQGATPVDLRTASDPSSFYAAISEAKQGNPHGAFVTAHDVSEYGDMKMFLGDDNGVGVAVTKDGDIVSVFKNPNISKSRKAVSSILLTAIDNGGVKLDNYNGELSRMYLAHGFIPVARTAFVDEYAPSDWNYERDGRPDIIFWMHNGNDIETVARNIGTQEMPDLKALPLMEYDEAAAYRDGLITKNASANSTLKDLGANTPTPAELKQSKVYTNTYDKWLTDAEKAADSVENSVYAVSKESDSIAMAKERVRASIDRTGGIDEAIHELAHGSWDAPDVDTAMLIGEVLRAEAAETGNYTKLNEWKQEIQRHMTESGQAIQALAKWTRDSSIGAETALDKAVADINKQNQKRIDSGKMAPIEVNPELLAELNNTQTRSERDAVMSKIAADIGSKMPAGILDKIRAWRYLSMLGNPRTVLRNLIGNEIMSDVLWTSKDAVGAALEKVMGVEQSQRTKALAFGDAYKANKAYAATTLDDARTALEDSSRYDTKSGIERAIDENRQIFKFKPVEKWREATNWALSKGDTVFLEKQYKRSFAQIMTARGYTHDTMTAKQRSECMSYAINEAKRSTFHDASVVADAISKFENRNVVTKILVGGVLPFKKTPINVLARGVDFSPIGLIQGTAQYVTKVKSGEMSAAQAVDKISSGLTGSALMALGFFLAKSGIITGGNEDEDKYYMSDLGHQDFALNLGDGKSVTIDWAAPATIPLFMGVALNSTLEGEIAEGENKLDALINTLSGITDPLVEMSMLQGLQDTLEAAAKATKNGESMIWGLTKNAAYNYVSSFIPTIGGQIARTVDPVRRDTSGDPTTAAGKELDKVANKMQAKIPGLASNLQPYVNIWGEQEINEHSWPVRLLEQTILPGYLDEVDMTPVDMELTRLYSVTQDPSVVPSNYPYRTLKSGDERYVLTADEYTEFKIENGRAMYAAAEDAINSSQYSRMSDDEKASYVAKAIKDAQNDILKRYKKKYLGK